MGLPFAPALPLHAWIVTTNRCNVNCRICPIHGPERHVEPERLVDMNPVVYERVRRELLPSLRWVYVPGLGEPFLAPIFHTMLDDFLPAGKQVLVVTNGTILHRDSIERLVRTPSKIVVSLDGTTPEVLEYIRKGVKFERVMAFLRTVKELRERCGHPGFEFAIGFVITRTNITQMTNCVELAHRFGMQSVSFTNFAVAGRKDEFRHESLTNHPEMVLPHWRRAKQRATELGIDVPPIYFECADRPEEERRRHQPTLFDNGRIRQCPVPWWNVYVDVNGDVRPCCGYPVMWPMGNLLDRSFRQIWNGPKFRELRRRVNTPGMPEPCRHCFMPLRF